MGPVWPTVEAVTWANAAFSPATLQLRATWSATPRTTAQTARPATARLTYLRRAPPEPAQPAPLRMLRPRTAARTTKDLAAPTGSALLYAPQTQIATRRTAWAPFARPAPQTPSASPATAR